MGISLALRAQRSLEAGSRVQDSSVRERRGIATSAGRAVADARTRLPIVELRPLLLLRGL